MGFDKSLNSLSYLRVKEVPNQEALEQATALYQQEKISLGRTAEMAGITRWELMRLLMADWELASQGQAIFRIEPLKYVTNLTEAVAEEKAIT